MDFVKSYTVEFFSGEECGHELSFDGVDIKADKSLIDKSWDFVKTNPGVDSVTLNVQFEDITLYNKDGEEINKEEVPIIFCHILVNENFSCCRLMLDENEDVLVECAEMEHSM